MPDHGIIYQAPSKIKRFIYRVVRGFGAGLFSFAIVAVIFTFYPIVRDEYFQTPQKMGFGDLIGNSKAGDYGLDSYFSIYIPKMNARANVIPNVDPGNQKEYFDALKDGVAHALGTGFPGDKKTTYLFSHSTDSPLNFARYNAIFYLLRKLDKGDRIIVYYMDQQYEYIVDQKLTTAANDTSWLTDNTQGERLVLQTCDPPGTTLRRLLVVAKPAY